MWLCLVNTVYYLHFLKWFPVILEIYELDIFAYAYGMMRLICFMSYAPVAATVLSTNAQSTC